METVLAVVIPTLNEAQALPRLLDDLARLEMDTDIVVADGGSADATAAAARRAGARVVLAERGRGRQLRAGAEAVRGDPLFFVHADVRLPAAARDALRDAVRDGVEAAVFRFAIGQGGIWPRIMEVGARLRDRIGGLPYGDQGLLVSRRLLGAVGGYPDVPIMEDVAVIRALKRHRRIARLDAPLVVSPRRWRREGPYRTWFRNVTLLTGYLAGVPAARLARWYPPEEP